MAIINLINIGKSVDARGRFVFDSLPSGEYEVYLLIESNTIQKRLQQTISVSNGAITQINFAVDLQARDTDH